MGKKQDVEKARFWRRMIHEVPRSGLSTREFCRQRRLHESQLYWWQCRLVVRPGSRAASRRIELVLAGGRRLRIAKGLLGKRARRDSRPAQYKARMPARLADHPSAAWGRCMQRARQPHRRAATLS